VAANLRELLDELSGRYPNVPESAIKVHLLQARGQVLPHMEKALRRIAAARLRAQRIDLRTDAKAERVDDTGVDLEDGSRITARTVIWAAGVRPAAIAGSMRGLTTDDGGHLRVDEYLRVDGRHGIYALGDCAAVKSGGEPVAPTAQSAVQEARIAADNLVAELRGTWPKPFRYRSRGRLVDLGSRFAVARVLGTDLSGGLAQLLWRALYLYKLGGAANRARVLSDWMLEAAGAGRASRLPL
jgi:NADH dehydrogenase